MTQKSNQSQRETKDRKELTTTFVAIEYGGFLRATWRLEHGMALAVAAPISYLQAPRAGFPQAHDDVAAPVDLISFDLWWWPWSTELFDRADNSG
jgi:hypothetical protein